MKSKRFWILSGVGLAMMFAMASIAAATTHPPDINPANFVHPITNPNPFFPLVPGTTFNYTGEKDGVPNTNVTQVTCDILVIEGVTTTVVHDQALDAGGNVEEDTFDYYAQDKDGNVWYFGEHTMELADGRPTTLAGTFLGGVNGAQPGIIMEAHPAIGDFYRQEFDLRNAEDFAEVVSLTETVTVPTGTYSNCLKTKETTPLETSLLENKYYAPNVGNVSTVDLTTGQRVELVGITME